MINTLAFIITLIDDEKSMAAAKRCIESIKKTNSPITPVIFPAVTPKTVYKETNKRNLEYSYPVGSQRMEYNMVLTPYETKDIDKRIACSMSHMILWEQISDLAPFDFYIILEQDAIFTDTFDQEYFDEYWEEDFVCSLNSPIGATRRASIFDQKLKMLHKQVNDEYIEVMLENEDGDVDIDEDQSERKEIKHFEIPWIDNKQIPQGLPGNSAYLITPGAAKRLVQGMHDLDIWPNDAMMCKQFYPDMLYSAYPYYTKVQGNKSTTSL